jgi:hypothetical protein
MLFKNSVRTSKRTPHFTITKINWLTLFKFKHDDYGRICDNAAVVVMVQSENARVRSQKEK